MEGERSDPSTPQKQNPQLRGDHGVQVNTGWGGRVGEGRSVIHPTPVVIVFCFYFSLSQTYLPEQHALEHLGLPREGAPIGQHRHQHVLWLRQAGLEAA